MGTGMEKELGDLNVMMYYIGVDIPASGIACDGSQIEVLVEMFA